jgi:hypothetical protein
MFSAMRVSESPLAMARRVKSTTCCEDRQSQMPIDVKSRLSISCRAGSQPRRGNQSVSAEERQRRTITGNNDELLLSSRGVDDDVWVDGDDLMLSIERIVLLELEVSDSSRESEVACRKQDGTINLHAIDNSNWTERLRRTEDEPLTRPNSTNPPAAVIRSCSSLLTGLWSCESGSSFPPTEISALESPALAYRTQTSRMRVISRLLRDN